MFITTVIIGVLITIFNKQEKKVPEDLRSLSELLIWTIHIISPGVINNNMIRHQNCIIHLNKIFVEYCHAKLKLGEAIIWIILMLLAIVFSFVIRIFSYKFLMHKKFIIVICYQIFIGWRLVVQNISTIIQTILVEESPLTSALLNVGMQGLYGEYVIFKSPMKRIGENQLGGVYLWVVESGGIASLILTALNALSSMNNVGFKVISNIIFKVSIILLIIISGFAGYTVVGRIAVNL
ncbi:MAG: hypothetical protein EZS28_013482 [Streblomastix strix]|uniref:Uncharacterized protein n=1 Tax=Streblomastix strix TaxID=222440 RepID=A0A5J4W8D9_9EUKA|nr:MAG: hypothetical protein EZS28_013482 [Streblomastix strix]